MSNERIIYLAGPIRSVGLEEAVNWRRQVSTLLIEHGWICFDPASAFYRPDQIGRSAAGCIESINRQAIAMSSIVLAQLDSRSVNLGTIRELEAGSAAGKRCILVCQENLRGKVSTYDLEVYQRLDSALAAITGESEDLIMLRFNKSLPNSQEQENKSPDRY